MNKERKTAVVEEIAAQIKSAEAIFAIDYRGISVPQAAELRARLDEAGARFRVVKNTLTERAVDDAGAESLKQALEGPTAFTFVPAEGGDVALAAKALSQFRRANDVLEFKGGVMGGEPLTVEQIDALARLPALDVLHGQLVGVLASPVTGLVRGLNQLIAGLAIALGQIQAEGKVGGDAEPEPEAAPEAEPEPAAEAEPEAAAEAETEEAETEEPEAEPEPQEEPPPPEDGPDAGEDAAAEAPGDPVAEGEAAEQETETDTEETPSEGGPEKEG